jgi:enamine deaminase RidA (YjgF/YER057c/UK114 family)
VVEDEDGRGALLHFQFEPELPGEGVEKGEGVEAEWLFSRGRSHRGKMVYIAGQVALNREGQQVGQDDFSAQVRQVFANLNEALKSAGGSFADVIKLNYYCVDRVERSQLSAVRETRDQNVNRQAPPVSTFLFVRGLVMPEWLIEIEAVAVI